ncbi:MAG: hypothetical protein U5K69_02350 [Balneolaceae bacterium]|nr:hypothetical protein [Balneolaceae bacterium]
MKSGALRHINELLDPPFHAVEFYFNVTPQDDKQPSLGSDPEHRDEDQLIEELQFISFQQFQDLPVVPAYLHKNFLEDSTSCSGGVIFSSYTP